jgi:hypothetical protein
MAFNKAPSNWLAGYAANSTNSTITFNTADVSAPATASFPELTNAEANVTSGDFRKIFFSILDALFKKFSATPVADRPTKINLNRSSVINADDTITHTYVFTVNVAGSSFEVANEPS